MKSIITSSEAEFDRAAADIIISAIKSPSPMVVGLSTGRTTGNMHRLVAKIHEEEGFDASKTTFFALDEVTGIPRENRWACHAKLKYEVLDALGVDDSHFLALPTISDDMEKAAEDFYAELQGRGGIGLLILGIGENGHLGFNQPGSAFAGGPHVSTMDEGLENRIREDCGLDSSARIGGVTLTIEEIMTAKKIVLVAKGADKAEVMDRAMNGPVTNELPASILQTHPDCTALMDSAAASKLMK